MMKIKNFNILKETIFKTFFIIFLFLLSLKVNLQLYIPGKYLFIISLLLNIVIFQFLSSKYNNKYKYYLVGSILIFNFLFDERFLIANYGFNSLYSYSNALILTIFIPIFLFALYQLILLSKNESLRVFLIITFFSISIDLTIYLKDYLNDFRLLKNIEFFIFLIFVIFLFNTKIIKNKNTAYLFLIFKFYLPTSVIILAYFYFTVLSYKKLNKYIYYIPILIIFIISSLDSFYHTTKSNPDNYIFFIGGLKSNFFNLPIYKAALDIKGFMLYEIFKFSSKLILFLEINQWFVFIFLILVILFVVNFCIYKLLSLEKISPEIIIFIQFFITQDLLFDSNETRIGARIIGSTFVLLSLYFLYLEKYFYSSLFLISAIFTLISFIIPAFLVLIYITVLKIKKYYLYMCLNAVLFIFYLTITNQLYEYYILNLDFVINYSSLPYTNIPTLGFLNIFVLLLIPIFLISLKIDFKLIDFKTINLQTMVFVWFIGELLHLYISESRFDHYKNLLIIPVYLLLGIVITNESKFDFRKILIVFIAILVGYSNTNSSYNYEVKLTNLTFNDIEINKNVAKKDFSYGVFLSNLLNPHIYYPFLDNHSIIQGPRSWLLFENPEHLNFNEEEMFTFFKEDLRRYEPSVVLVTRDFELANSYNFIQNFIDSLEIMECNDIYCTYNFKK